MKNSISVSVDFYFKGEKFSPSMVVDLDEHIKADAGVDSIYATLANSNDIGLYSYEYEMMLAEDLVFSDPTGIAEGFLQGSEFDFVGFKEALGDEAIMKNLSEVAAMFLSVTDLSAQPDLKAALFAAFRLGRKAS